MGIGTMQDLDQLQRDLETTLAGAGLSLLECAISRPRGNVKVKAVIYAPAGTGTNECAKATRLIMARCQVVMGVQEAEIEVSSPGIDRVIKSGREWSVFTGKAVRFLLKGEEAWREGRLESASEGRVRIAGQDYDIASIAKARLDSTKEGE